MFSEFKKLIIKTFSFHQKDTSVTLSKIFLWSTWLVYVGYLLLSDLPPGLSLLHITSETLQEIWNLSLNFWLVLPIVSPNVAPVINPALEGLFNIVVTWAILFWGFVIDGRNQRFPIVPFLIGTALLTNVFFLPWLALRQPNPQPPTDSLTFLEKIAESRILPAFLGMIFVVSLVWGAFARPEYGDLTTRFSALLELLSTDRLAYSFLIDLLVFWLFQSWLVKDDMARRNWCNPTVLRVVRLVPFLGLVVYLWRRPSLAVQQMKAD
ncbi:hypothetical protein I8748_16325 [Nostoc sp. CENA67]|uniref:DUF2834 domain-containing protein n=1 Tax=Amazonocrinis nigriterrae CENA67 TaxID=2794033 RepID=A0A8J7L8U6_9NOST|nr:hypothetical protein [Amazonocrinis nigriterrae]MBH8563738.1 hypothetical protein [Amazonocrinis nigriterrae CENA67]